MWKHLDFLPEEGLRRGILRDFDIFANLRLKLYSRTMTTASKHPPTGALVAPPYVTRHTLHKVSLVIDFYDHCNVYVIISKQVFDNIILL